MSTVNVNVRVADPDAFVAVIVKAVADATVVGVPVSAPVEVLNVSPAGAAGEMEYEAIVPPAEASIVYPAIALLTVLVSEDDESVKAGAAIGAVVGATSTTGTAPVVITGVIDKDGEVPSTLTAAMVNVYEVRWERLVSDSSPELLGETLLIWPVLILVIR